MLVYPKDRETDVTTASSEAFVKYSIIYLIFLNIIHYLLMQYVT